jgi:hypothetical protein
MAPCPSCGRELAGEFAFCPHCGAQLAARAPAREQRKTVTVAKEGQHLLDEERVALSGLEDPAAKGVVGAAELREQQLAVLRRERLEQHGGRVQLPAAPGRALVQELRPRQAKKEKRRAT